MNEHDVIRFMGRFPDRIIDKSESIMNRGEWFCSQCGKPKKGNPCECGSIFWETKRKEAK